MLCTETLSSPSTLKPVFRSGTTQEPPSVQIVEGDANLDSESLDGGKISPADHKEFYWAFGPSA